MSGNPRRLDLLLVEKGLAPSRARAKEWIEEGRVKVCGLAERKPSALIAPEAELELDLGGERVWVSRGALKLLAALEHFAVDPSGRIAFDIGASTGGFTEVLLARGASRVYAVDVGHGQLAPRIQSDPRVRNYEGYHAREFNPEDFPDKASLLVMDVSFISIRHILPPVMQGLLPGADLLVLFKPQFEVGREAIGSGGIVRDADAREKCLRETIEWSQNLPLRFCGLTDSPIHGGDGNREYLVHWTRI
jgi:23S rRNA (cytidine1920-2'-O)/16S rRNA (cytidine1409-2'-O)-methyltransferase